MQNCKIVFMSNMKTLTKGLYVLGRRGDIMTVHKVTNETVKFIGYVHTLATDTPDRINDISNIIGWSPKHIEMDHGVHTYEIIMSHEKYKLKGKMLELYKDILSDQDFTSKMNKLTKLVESTGMDRDLYIKITNLYNEILAGDNSKLIVFNSTIHLLLNEFDGGN